MNEVISQLINMAGVNQTNIWVVMSFLALILGGLQTSITHALKQEKLMSRDDRSAPKSSHQDQGFSSWWDRPLLDKHALLLLIGGKGFLKKRQGTQGSHKTDTADTDPTVYPEKAMFHSSSSNVIDFPSAIKGQEDENQSIEEVSPLSNLTRGSARR